MFSVHYRRKSCYTVPLSRLYCFLRVVFFPLFFLFYLSSILSSFSFLSLSSLLLSYIILLSCPCHHSFLSPSLLSFISFFFSHTFSLVFSPHISCCYPPFSLSLSYSPRLFLPCSVPLSIFPTLLSEFPHFPFLTFTPSCREYSYCYCLHNQKPPLSNSSGLQPTLLCRNNLEWIPANHLQPTLLCRNNLEWIPAIHLQPTLLFRNNVELTPAIHLQPTLLCRNLEWIPTI